MTDTQVTAERSTCTVLYCMSNVCAFADRSNVRGIPGYCALIADARGISLSWTPYYSLPSPPGLVGPPPFSAEIYAVRIPISDIISIRQCFPKYDNQNLIITVKAGGTFEPFYFMEGGIHELVKTLKQITKVIVTPHDPTLLLLNPSVNNINPLVPPPATATTRTLNPEPAPHAQSQPELPRPSPPVQKAAGWGLFEGMKKLAKDASTLLQYYDTADTDFFSGESSAPLDAEENTELGEFDILNKSLVDPTRTAYAQQNVHKQPRGPPLNAADWINSFGANGVLRNPALLKEQIYHGGMDDVLRPEVWKYLLGYYPFDSTYREREIIKQQREIEYKIYSSQWESITPEQESHFSKFRSLKERIDKDVVRTDRTWPYYESDESPHLQELYRILLTYSFFNFDIGYVQGMNDLVSVLLVVMQNETDAFWCFKGLMDRMMMNFDKDQVGMHTQLTQLSDIVKYMDEELYKHLQHVNGTNMFFCFRWLLILFKREYLLEHVKRIWEVIWANHYGPHHHLFIALAMLFSVRDEIISKKMEFDDILRFLNERSKKMNHEEILQEADYLYRKFIVLCDCSEKIFSFKSAPKPVPRRR